MMARGLERRDTSSERNRINGIFKGRGRRRIPGAIAPDRLNGKDLPPHCPDACGLRTRIPGRTVLRATMARRAGLHDQRPELLPALFFLSFALLVVTASLTRVVIVPAGVRYFLHHSFKRAACKIHSHSSVSSSHGGVSSSSGSSAISSSSPSSYSQ